MKFSDCVRTEWYSTISGTMTEYFCPQCWRRAGWTQGTATINHDPTCPRYVPGTNWDRHDIGTYDDERAAFPPRLW